MDRFVAFIRNVMVGRQGLTKDVLLRIVEERGGTRPYSHITTGNVSFDADPGDVARLAVAVADGVADVIGRREEVIVRSLAELRRREAARPFDPLPFDHVHERAVTFTDADVAEIRAIALPSASTRGDCVIFATDGSDVYSVTRMIDGRTGSAGPILERLLHRRVTSRDWRTVERILAAHGG